MLHRAAGVLRWELHAFSRSPKFCWGAAPGPVVWLLALTAFSGAASASVVYDHLLAVSGQLGPVSLEHAEFVTLGSGATTISSARVRLGSFSAADAGTLALSFYADNAGQPGSLLASFSQPAVIGATAVPIDFTGLSVASPASVWVSTMFTSSGPATAGVRLSLLSPSVGSVDATIATRSGGAGAWGLSPTDRWMEMQINNVPGPSAALVLAIPALVSTRRRR